MNQRTYVEVEQWGVFELSILGPADGNPFVDYQLSGEFRFKNRIVEVPGFYDGDGTYKLRFMPDVQGEWTFETKGNHPSFSDKLGAFVCTKPTERNHGPVQVSNKYHFSYRDGTPYLPFGTTCYVWNHQTETLEQQTIGTLKSSPFNKMRMCVFPKHYDFNHNEPQRYPFEGNLDDGWDFERFNPSFFHHLETRIEDLMALGIEADLILFHPYDRWGYAEMDPHCDDRYLRYVVARLSAYRNVWWSLANEYDLMKSKTMEDWDRFFAIIQESDPYHHLCSIHNCRGFYNHGRHWVTHASIQSSELQRVAEWRSLFGKPVVIDECCYEGNINHGWGNISAQEMTHRTWLGVTQGGYVGHGETYMDPNDVLWWAKGGVLHGESPERIEFLRRIVEKAPYGLEPINLRWDVSCAGKEGEYYLMYFGIHRPSFRPLNLPDGHRYKIDVIDIWNMTIMRLPGDYEGDCRVDLPGREYIALRITRI